MKGYRPQLQRLKTEIPGFDAVCHGGLPLGRSTLVTGTAGSAKTVFAAQFLAEGIEKTGQPAVFVTFEETPGRIRQNMSALGWNIAAWEREGKWLFVDASPVFADDQSIVGQYDLNALMARVENAVKKTGAKRLSIDSITSIFHQLQDSRTLRYQLLRLVHLIDRLGVTAIITAERESEYGPIARLGIEEFVADNVIILRNVLEDEKRRRTLEVLKFRGASHHKGESAFTLTPNDGIVVIPLSSIELDQRSSDARVVSGIPELDNMCGGGFFRDSVVLVSGATGTGKTLLTTQFLGGGAANKERCLLFAFEESRDQLARNARGWGINFPVHENSKLLNVVCEYPERMSLEDHLIRIKATIDEYKPQRLAIDSLSAIERVSTVKGFREFVIGLTHYVKQKEIMTLFTSTTPNLTGGPSATEAHISTLTDSIILLRYVEMYGEMKRGITVLKMRGSKHDKEIREFHIDDKGMHIGPAFRDVTGILSGVVQHTSVNEIDRVRNIFKK
ncbi:MAG TPA: circadian clock protein KaiC [Planctomycetota bacterium]|nr:circadian clock protein KaiC [Planctomycetota bacterium]